jgi:hypothetical protein
MKVNGIFLSIPLFFFITTLPAQNVYFNFSDGTTATFDLAEIRKVDFSADVMNVHLWNGSVYAWNVSVINSFQPETDPVGVEDFQPISKAMDVLLFPNPSTREVSLRYNLPNEDEVHYALLDAGGKHITEIKLGKQAPGDYQQVLNLSELSSGNYLIRFTGKNGTISKVLIKN